MGRRHGGEHPSQYIRSIFTFFLSHFFQFAVHYRCTFPFYFTSIYLDFCLYTPPSRHFSNSFKKHFIFATIFIFVTTAAETASPITAPVTEGNYMEKRICGTLSGKAPEICQYGKLANFA
ncbi:uncharacterized protein RCO7_14055 [Rhynchosporium graminicola]|uniref:Uncharacterized protein n=1 Tax=Rhynchosporium graminicola TaxID=2792576 RepID=A0A1E1LKG5_9HELO|nr:uncharacterized protein RCO7_14055 [Rhynchosporium commune]